MMGCVQCGGALRHDRRDFTYRDGELQAVTVENIQVRICTVCGHNEWMLSFEKVRRAIARVVAEKEERLAPEEVRYLRKWLKLSNTDFAHRMGVRPETVCRWERKDSPQPMELASERFLRLMVACECLRKGPELNLDAIGTKAATPRKLRLLPVGRDWKALEA
jgi:YgiT-type zinc finger domain-containing protein